MFGRFICCFFGGNTLLVVSHEGLSYYVVCRNEEGGEGVQDVPEKKNTFLPIHVCSCPLNFASRQHQFVVLLHILYIRSISTHTGRNRSRVEGGKGGRNRADRKGGGSISKSTFPLLLRK